MNDLLLLHGALGDTSQFDWLLPELAESKPVAINFRGHGGEKPEGGFGIENFARDVVAWMDANNKQRVDIFGYSMGGYVALWLKLNYPQRVGKVMTLATKFAWTPASARAETKFLDPERIEEKVPAYAKKLAATHGEENWKKLLSQTAEMMHALGEKPLLKEIELGSISGNVLISVGDRDGMVSIEESADAFRYIPEARFLVLPATPHPLEKVNKEHLLFAMRGFFSA